MARKQFAIFDKARVEKAEKQICDFIFSIFCTKSPTLGELIKVNYALKYCEDMTSVLCESICANDPR